jgi:hypothetical protein
MGTLPGKSPMKSPQWSKGCLRPHSPFTIGAGTPILSTNPNSNESITNISDNSGNRTLKRFMSMKKSKANEFFKRGNYIE